MNNPTRLKFKEHERKYEWLSPLLEAYYQNDIGTHNEMVGYFKEKETKIACHKGCCNCCINQIVPITEIELRGISWYISEIITNFDLRKIIKTQMKKYKERPPCPFLVNKECSIYPLRPIACREFHVMKKPCAKDEDASKSRPEDIWRPSREVARKTAMKLLPAFGFSSQSEMLYAYENGFIHQNASPMYTIEWRQLVKVMDLFDSVQPIN